MKKDREQGKSNTGLIERIVLDKPEKRSTGNDRQGDISHDSDQSFIKDI